MSNPTFAVEPLDRRVLCVVTGSGVGANLSATPIAINVLNNEIIQGAKTTALVDVLNNSKFPATGSVNLTLVASKDKTYDPLVDRTVGVTLRNLHSLAPHHTLRLNVPVKIPTDLPTGTVNILGLLTPTKTDPKPNNNHFAFPTRLRIRPRMTASADLSLAFGTLQNNFPFGVNNTVPFSVKNKSNFDYNGGLRLRLYSSFDKIFGNSDDRLLTSYNYTNTIKAHASVSLPFTFMTPSDFQAGERFIGAQVLPLKSNKPNLYIFSSSMIKF